MKLLRIGDINKLPNGTYLGNVNQAHTFTPFAKEVLAKQLFTLGLQNKEYFSVAEIKEAIDKHTNQQLLPIITSIPTEVVSEPLINSVKPSEVVQILHEITPLEIKESITDTSTSNQELEESKVTPSKKKRT